MPVVSDYTALLSGYTYYQQEGSGQPVILTYSFPTAPPEYFIRQYREAVPSFAPLNDSEKQSVRDALAQISRVAGVTFLETRSSEGDLTFAFYQLAQTGGGNAAGQGGYPNGFVAPDGRVYDSPHYGGGDVWLDVDYRMDPYFTSGLPQLLLHEIGHALGLKHPHDIVGSHDSILNGGVDNTGQTVMSYVHVQPTPTVLGPLDVAALQFLYGPASAAGSQFSRYSWDAEAERLTAYGSEGADMLRGTGASDVIVGNGGYDRIATFQGNDTIVLKGGLGDVAGGSGLDTVFTTLASTQVTGFGGSATHSYYRVGPETTYLQQIERVVFSDKTIALDLAGTAGQSYRLYQAAFDRTPDTGGLSFHVREMDRGVSLHDTAARFIASGEFRTLYGANPSDEVFVTALYRNVLDRAPDPGGLAHWTGVLGQGGDRAGVLTGFSESAENVALVGPAIAAGITLDSSVLYG